MFLTLKDKVWWFALYSRIFVLVTSAVFNFLIPDHSADAFVAPKPNEEIEETFADYVVRYLFEGLVRWDAQYFIHISQYGYTYENCLAFFPLFPLLTRVFTQFIYLCVSGYLNEYSLYLITSLLINLFCFVKSASLLFELSLRVLRNESLAYKAAILFCINPASIFFTAPYSESMFCCLSFYGMLKCCCGFKNNFSVNCGIIFGLSAITRSNGILNIGFIIYKALKNISDKIQPKLQELRGLIYQLASGIPSMLPLISVICLPYIISCIIAILPFISFQMYAYSMYCTTHNHSLPDFLITFAHLNNLILPGGVTLSTNQVHWCEHSIPLSYSYIQSYYWNVGFLRYYTWKQFPNFLLACPVLWLIFSCSYKYFVNNKQYCMRLGLNNSLVMTKKNDNENVLFNKQKNLISEDVFPYIVHILILTTFSLFCAHIQVTTRLISSSSPVLYWLCAEIVHKGSTLESNIGSLKLPKDLTRISKREKEKQEDLVREDIESLENMCSHWKVFIVTSTPSHFYAKFIQIYFILYTIVGTILFSNFLPWT